MTIFICMFSIDWINYWQLYYIIKFYLINLESYREIGYNSKAYINSSVHVSFKNRITAILGIPFALEI